MLQKLRRLPDHLLDFLSLESVLKDTLPAGTHGQRLWRQFELSEALFEEAVKKFPALNRTAVVRVDVKPLDTLQPLDLAS